LTDDSLSLCSALYAGLR
jgi:DNA replicative helicase MCM subunit Mcm2 (Cdc46/Mcm family)